jgi:hypothetical protein
LTTAPTAAPTANPTPTPASTAVPGKLNAFQKYDAVTPQAHKEPKVAEETDRAKFHRPKSKPQIQPRMNHRARKQTMRIAASFRIEVLSPCFWWRRVSALLDGNAGGRSQVYGV